LKGLTFLDDERLAFSMARGSAVDFGALHREITTIYLIMPVHELTGNGAKLLRMFVNLALRGLYQNPPTSGATLPPVLFMLDEFGSCLGSKKLSRRSARRVIIRFSFSWCCKASRN
jgi:type IV secretory pathway TraG/TraD family ATPase VirD4